MCQIKQSQSGILAKKGSRKGSLEIVMAYVKGCDNTTDDSSRQISRQTVGIQVDIGQRAHYLHGTPRSRKQVFAEINSRNTTIKNPRRDRSTQLIVAHLDAGQDGRNRSFTQRQCSRKAVHA